MRCVLRGVPATVWALTVLQLLLGVCYALAIPTFRGPDEANHVDLVLFIEDQLAGEEPPSWPEPTQRRVAERVTAAAAFLDAHGAVSRRDADDAPARRVRPAFDDLDASHGSGAPGASPEAPLNQLVQHPPAHYVLSAAWLSAAPGSQDWPVDRQVAHLRLLSALLLAPLPLLLHATARALTRSRSVAVAAAAAALLVPQLTLTGAVVNNDSLLVAASSLATVPLVHLARGDLSLRTSAWAGGALGVAVFAKGLALVLVCWPAVAYLLGWRRRGGSLPWGPAALGVATALLAGGWWWVRKVLRLGTVHVRGTVYASDPAFTPEPVTWLGEEFVPLMIERWWVSLVGVGTPLPFPTVLLVALPVALGVGLAVAWPARRQPGNRGDVLLLLVPTAAMLGLILWSSYTTYARTGRAVGIQGRYLFPGVVGLLAVMAHGYGVVLRRCSRWLAPAIFAVAGLLQVRVAYQVLLGYWGAEPGATVLGRAVPAVRSLLAWSPWPPALTGTALSATVALSVATGIALIVTAAAGSGEAAARAQVLPASTSVRKSTTRG